MGTVGRRQFLFAVSAMLTAPITLHAERGRTARPFRIGTFPDLVEPLEQALRKALAAAGWSEGADYVLIASKFDYGTSRVTIQSKLKGLFAQGIDLLFANSTVHALAAHRMSKAIPIVVWSCGYPVEAGLADSLARPGRNVTGMALYAGTGVWSKQLELLRESKPRVERVGVVWSYVPPDFPRSEIEPCYAELQSAGRSLNLKVHIEEFPTADRIPEGLQAIDAHAPDALLLTGGPGIWNTRQQIMKFAVDRRLPTISDFMWSISDSLRPLMSYGASFFDLIDQAARYVIRILSEGARASDLPFQEPAKLYLVVDLRAAKVLGLTPSPSILLRADRVIE